MTGICSGFPEAMMFSAIRNRKTQLNYWWDNVASGATSYPPGIAILSNQSAYEVSTGTSNYNRGLKLTSNIYSATGGVFNTSPDHTDSFGYDNNRDYLTSATYDGGTPVTWSYDAAGNRGDATVCDNLNRATTISGVSRSYDILGNTQTIGSTKSLGWDVRNRMASFTSGSTTTNYSYRCDAMRVLKTSGTQAVTYGYDGPIGVEECLTDTGTSSNNYTTRYGLGARGIDRIETTNSSGTSVGYPLYDAHGNMAGTVAKGSSAGTYAVGNLRSYDAWGGVRSGSTSGSPSPRHCASLGHVQDDESGLVYMRARYYEPSTGNFLSEDPKQDGLNYYRYVDNDPVGKVDQNGKDSQFFMYLMILLAAYYGARAVFWEPESVYGKCAKCILDATFAALGCLAGLDAITEMAETMDPLDCPGLVCSGICLMLLGLVLCAVAAYQLSMLVFLATEGDIDFPDGGKLSDGAGHGGSFAGQAGKIANALGSGGG